MSLQFYTGKNFWKSPSEYKPSEKVTKTKVKEIEKHLGVVLPIKYVSLMEEQNGGELSYRYVLFEDGDAAIVPYFHELEVETGVGLSPVFVDEFGLPDGVVVITGDFHSWLALDYREDKMDPKVIYITEDDSGNGTWQEHYLAKSFDEFTGRLFKKE
ncbi:SMI1/KNR4 family protein [Alkalihalobacillus sp. MEB130]|uniref:SMI1/KNR4 family protein n=1 Tax=Alkalihalobacillus sp. MEB130 TaxID=2976704 RepID=UPI0028DF2348|nr:SMI1/KNR4 family protein [Alkalihalobacillus sp. MEB130]MDT8860104.1 SMI1/KNR4 family protein [Alkalihalobacillus sp. MEB130]